MRVNGGGREGVYKGVRGEGGRGGRERETEDSEAVIRREGERKRGERESETVMERVTFKRGRRSPPECPLG